MGPAEAIQAHADLGARLSIAAHFQVFQLGWDGFDDAVKELTANMKKSTFAPGDFLAPTPGTPIELRTPLAAKDNPSGKTTRAPSYHLTRCQDISRALICNPWGRELSENIAGRNSVPVI
jgi:hypothetical protein